MIMLAIRQLFTTSLEKRYYMSDGSWRMLYTYNRLIHIRQELVKYLRATRYAL